MRGPRHRAVRAIAASCALLLLPACSGDPAPSPSTKPSTSSPPSATTPPTPPETSLEREQRLAFEAAEKSYRTFNAEVRRLQKAGGATGPTPVMRRTAAGKYLAFYVDGLRDQKRRRVTYTTGSIVGYVHRAGYSPAQLTLRVCEDASRNRVLDQAGKQISEGFIVRRLVYFRPMGGTWKLWNGDEDGQPGSCSSG